MSYLQLKALHMVCVVTWFAGLFYLPRLFVYHAMTDDDIGYERFCVMERKLYRGIMLPSALLTTLFGGLLIAKMPVLWNQSWLHKKLFVVLGVWVYHGFCKYYLNQFAKRSNQKSHVFFRIFNEVPVVFLIVIVFLAVLKPL